VFRRLLDARIGDARYAPDPTQELVGIGEVRVDVVPTNLQVDRGRGTEIEDLADDVSRQERERHAGKRARQFFAQRLYVFLGRPVTFLQLDLDIAILRADHAGVVVGYVDAADRHADVVGEGFDLLRRNDLPDGLLHIRELIGGFFDAGADLGTHMHQDRAGIDGG